MIHFKNNTAINGGAMALHGSSTLELYSGTEIVFEANHASELGGALYATSAHQTVFVFSYIQMFRFPALCGFHYRGQMEHFANFH